MGNKPISNYITAIERLLRSEFGWDGNEDTRHIASKKAEEKYINYQRELSKKIRNINGEILL